MMSLLDRFQRLPTAVQWGAVAIFVPVVMLAFVAIGTAVQWLRDRQIQVNAGRTALDLLGFSLGSAVLVALLALYFLPIIVAVIRKHPNTAPITVVTVLAGWTLVGYVVALAWSFTAIEREGKE